MKSDTNPAQRIKTLRETYGMSQEELADRSAVPLELIKKIEEGMIPDLAPLVKIARTLGVRLGTILDEDRELGPVLTRKGETPEHLTFTANQSTVRTDGLRYSVLAPGKAGRHMEPFLIEVPYGSDMLRSSHEGEEFFYVLQGKIRLEYGTLSYEMSEGDSIYYDSMVPHRAVALGGQDAKVLAVVYTPV
ncbi:MAG: cupin domain-containing protein [Spirochaetota bacterium]|jgi:quercetin dioxygenase-like cupin family protein/DNA-binding XRE family transcriptional regulator|uniref:cupin domain-containing protein n=1 Tax=Gracilinema caldarium TaxID=215591 RepID=UPI0016B7AC0A|nr:cupin domain-containing protein [Gracilinema caldarium]NLJ09231.1 cupin domain-containing protein [Treponema sp.]